MLLGKLPAGHRYRQLDVVGRVCRHKVDAAGLKFGQQDERVTETHLES
jgi:hypothetical protein